MILKLWNMYTIDTSTLLILSTPQKFCSKSTLRYAPMLQEDCSLQIQLIAGFG